MRHLEWLVQLCLIWHVMKIIKTHGVLLSKGKIFQLQKYPAVRTDDGEVIKKISKMCYDNNDTLENETNIRTAYGSSDSNNTTNILYVFRNILQQIQKAKCEQLRNRESSSQIVAQAPNEKTLKIQYGIQPFSIVEQLKLDEQKQKWQQEQQEQQLKLQQQQNALKLEQILHYINEESLGKAGSKKKKKKKKKKRKRKKQKPLKDKKKKTKPLLTHPAQILFASPTQKPLHHNHEYDNDQHYPLTTNKPLLGHDLLPIKKIKYILRKNTIFKKKKKEYLNHLKHIIYPFVKFIAFFTIINPFTIAIFVFSLVSPIVLGFLGFIGLSFFIKPALNLLFGIKHTVNAIKRKKLQQLRKIQRLRDSRRPITIHKHYYQQIPIKPPLTHRHYALRPPPLPHLPSSLTNQPKGPVRHALPPANFQRHTEGMKLFNPLLPGVKQKLEKEKYLVPNIKGHDDSFEQF